MKFIKNTLFIRNCYLWYLDINYDEKDPNGLFYDFSLDNAKMIMIAQKVNIVSTLLADTAFVRSVKNVIITTEREMANPVLKGRLIYNFSNLQLMYILRSQHFYKFLA